MRSRQVFGAALSGVVAVLAGAQAAEAQELEEVVVTARRTYERLQEVPVAITALSGATLTQKSILNAQDLQYHVPGLLAAPRVAGSNATYSIRGQSNPLNCFQFCAVVPYLNDVPYDRRFPILYDMESVQVLKGPQGVAFGRNTTGGAILLNSKRPTDAFEGYVNLRGGNLKFRQLDGAINVPVSDMISARAAFQFTRREGYTKDLSFGQDLDNIHNDNVRLSLAIKPTANLNSTFIAGWFREKINGSGTVLIGVGPISTNIYSPAAAATYGYPQLNIAKSLADQNARGPRVVRHGIPTNQRENRKYLQNQTTWDINDNLTLKNIASITEFWSKGSSESDGTWTPLNDSISYSPTAERQVTEELQLQANAFDKKLKFVGGFYTERTDLQPDKYGLHYMIQAVISRAGPAGMPGTTTANPALNYVPVFYPELGFGGGGDRWGRTRALFGQAQVDLGDWAEGLKLTAGVRRTWDRFFNIGTSPMFPGGNFVGGGQAALLATLGGNPYPWPFTPAPATCAIAGGTVANCVAPTVRLKNSGWSYAVTLNYDITDKVMVYVAHRRGYRAGTYNNPLLTSQVIIPPEILRDVEPGIKADYDLGSMKARTNVAAYYQWYNNLQQAVTVADPLTSRLVSITASAANAKVKGLEVEQTLFPAPGLELSGFLSYNTSKYKNIATPALAAQLGDRLPFQPKVQYGLTAVYRLRDVGPFAEIVPSLTYTHRSEVAFTGSYRAEPLSLQPGFGLLDGRIDFKGIGGSTLQASVFGRNLTNKLYVLGGNFASSTAGFSSVFYGAPRTYGVELRYDFGGTR